VEDQQEVVVDEPAVGEFFGFASMLDQTPHQTSAMAAGEAVCIEVDRHDIMVLLERKPHAGMDMLAVLGKQYHGSQRLVRVRSTRNPNEVIEEMTTLGEPHRRRGGALRRIVDLHHCVRLRAGRYLRRHQRVARQAGVGPVPVHPAEPVSLHAGGDAGAGDHDEPEPAGRQGPPARRTGLRVNRRAELEIQGLARKLNLLGEAAHPARAATSS
jgi:hypothetical protein